MDKRHFMVEHAYSHVLHAYTRGVQAIKEHPSSERCRAAARGLRARFELGWILLLRV